MNLELRLESSGIRHLANLQVKVKVSEQYGASILRAKVKEPKLNLKGLKCVNIFWKKKLFIYCWFQTYLVHQAFGCLEI
jgi:hypothetical protein